MSANVIVFDAQYMSEQVRLLERAERLMEEAEGILKKASNHTGWKCRERENINDKINDITKQLGKIGQGMTTTAEVLSRGRDNFSELEGRAETQAQGMADNIKNNYGFNGSTYGKNEKSKLPVTPVPEDPDMLTPIKTLLTFRDKVLKDGQAGLSQSGIEYIDALYNFITGDKRGLSGAADLFGLGDKSIGAWSGLYDYLKDFYPKTGGIFSTDNQKKVGGLGIVGSVFGLVSSAFEVADKIRSGELGTLEAIGEVIGAGDGVVDLWGSIEQFKYIGEEGPNFVEGEGLLSPLTCYSAIIKGYTAAISQGFKSVDKYSADGVWDLGDTGRTGIESGVTGLMTMADTLFFGLPSGALATFGITPETISADIENWADNKGQQAGNYILNDPALLNAYQNSGPIGKTAITFHAVVQSEVQNAAEVLQNGVKSAVDGVVNFAKALFKH